ncbi:MAG: hypothetical protein ACXVCN_04925 [Bdellovibrio sp.]
MINWLESSKFMGQLVDFFGRIQWESIKRFLTGRRFNLTVDDWYKIADILDKEHCVIATRRNAHLSTYMILFADWIMRPRWGIGYWSHICLNKTTGQGFNFSGVKVLQAVGSGAKLSSFKEVFDCDAVVLLRPRGYTAEDMKLVIAEMEKNIGKPYDNFGNLSDESAVNCVEDVYDGLNETPQYKQDLPRFAAMVDKYKTISPQMFYDCGDFEIVLEIRR